MAYIDGFLAPVLAGREEAYKALARTMAPVFLAHGALQVVEALDAHVPHGKRTDLWRAVASVEGERLVLSWMIWPDRATRDAGWAKIMEDERMKPAADMPFDAQRMIFGGFEAFLDTAQD